MYMYMYILKQAVNVDALCATIPEVVKERCPDMEDQAESVMSKFGRALLLFSKCHNGINSSHYFKDSELSALRKIITIIIAQIEHNSLTNSIFPSSWGY